eukprot:scaffold144782_cov21-Tisochrysis_lutea.AAC.2
MSMADSLTDESQLLSSLALNDTLSASMSRYDGLLARSLTLQQGELRGFQSQSQDGSVVLGGGGDEGGLLLWSWLTSGWRAMALRLSCSGIATCCGADGYVHKRGRVLSARDGRPAGFVAGTAVNVWQ